MIKMRESNSKYTANRLAFAIIFVLAGIWYMLATTSVYGATRTNNIPITCYGIASKRYTTWSSVNGPKTGYIDGAKDECIILEAYENGWCRVQYPISGGKKKIAYTWMEFFFSNTQFSHAEMRSGQKKTVYRKSDCKKTLGTVYSGDNILVIGQSGNATQIVYPTSKGYKMGWVSGSIGDHNPRGHLDKAEVGSNGTLTVAGWVYDYDNPGKSLDVHVYVGGKFVAGFPANLPRTDVNRAYPGVGDYHGFSQTISNINLKGTQTVTVYGINVGAGRNIGFGEKKVNFGGSSSTSSPAVTGNTKLSYGLYQNSSARISCGFDGYTTTKGRHEGIDMVHYNGASVYSLTDGVITNVSYGSNGSNGLSTIAIYDSSANKTVVYLHSNPISLSKGQKITRGQKIATQGWRGVKNKSGSHTHVEIRNGWQTHAAKSVNDYKLDNPNPTSYWKSKGYVIQ